MILTRCLGCPARIPVGSRKGRCPRCLSTLDGRRNAITPALREYVIARAKARCEIGRRGCTGVATEVDHLLPLSRGGSDALYNLRAACKPCNSGRRDRL